jgi:sugar-specific transcriptional regulator TrmB
MYQDALMNLGLSDKDAAVYEALLSKGPMTVPDMLATTPYKRGDLYNIIASLDSFGLLAIQQKGKRKVYAPADPAQLESLVREAERDVEKQKKHVERVLPEFISLYRLISGKPGMRLYEGKEGIIRAYEELLDLRAPIDSIEDKGEMAAFIPEYFPKFIKKRISRGIRNRVVAPSTNEINETSEKELRETRTVDVKKFPFGMDIKICGRAVLMVTLTEAQAIAVRMDHDEIAANFRVLFELLWHQAERRLPAGGGSPRADDTSLTVFNT